MQETPCRERPTVYFDGACPVCSREIAMYRRQPGGEHVCWVDAAACDEAELGPGLDRASAMARLHLRRPDGRLVDGAEAFALLWRALPRWSWLGRLFGSGLGLRLLEAAYRVFLFLRRVWRPVPGSSGPDAAPSLSTRSPSRR